LAFPRSVTCLCHTTRCKRSTSREGHVRPIPPNILGSLQGHRPRFSERCRKLPHHRERSAAWTDEHPGDCGAIGRAKTRYLGGAGYQAHGRTGRCYGCHLVLNERRCCIHHWTGNCCRWRPVSPRLDLWRKKGAKLIHAGHAAFSDAHHADHWRIGTSPCGLDREAFLAPHFKQCARTRRQSKGDDA
jgi:hypothetical protein